VNTTSIVQYSKIVIYYGIFAQSRNCGARERAIAGNGCVTHKNGVTVGSGVFCIVHAEAI
jgi:hypothetical protein